MDKDTFQQLLSQHADTIAHIRQSAHELHRSVNQTYGDHHPYGFHLDMVADGVRRHGYLVCACEDDILPMFFGAYYHDSIEDARLTYNDVMNTARTMMTEEQALMATEIVYALTNDKGRTRAERAGERYYAGIRQTPYAPFIKLCDRLANISYSCSGEDHTTAARMKAIYKQEVPHFLASIQPLTPPLGGGVGGGAYSSDPRLAVPTEVIEEMTECLLDDMEREERDGLREA